jgi:site-specific DNA recombinase
MEKAVGYVRVSTREQQREGISLEAQGARIKSYVATKGLELVAIYREQSSGGVKLDKRPEGKRLVEALAKRDGPRHVIAIKLDRLFRKAADALVQVEQWDKAKCALHIVDMGGASIDTRSAIGRMFFTMTAAFAEMERNLTGERTRDTMAHLRDSGRVYCHITPLGFDRRADKTLAPNRAEQATIKRILRMRRSGLSMGRIADRLNNSGVPTKRGGKWYAVTIQKILARAA